MKKNENLAGLAVCIAGIVALRRAADASGRAAGLAGWQVGGLVLGCCMVAPQLVAKGGLR